jgi:hypothetical protein
MIVLRDIEFHRLRTPMAPIIGRPCRYLPTNSVGISKLARVVDAYARRFQVQEKLTAQIAHCIDMVLKPRGVGVVIDAHQCMTTRGVHKRGVSMISSQMLGTFARRARAEFLRSSTSTPAATAAEPRQGQDRLWKMHRQPAAARGLVFIFITVLIDILAFGLVIPVLPHAHREFPRRQRLAGGDLVRLVLDRYMTMQFFFTPVQGALSDCRAQAGSSRRTSAPGLISS